LFDSVGSSPSFSIAYKSIYSKLYSFLTAIGYSSKISLFLKTAEDFRLSLFTGELSTIAAEGLPTGNSSKLTGIGLIGRSSKFSISLFYSTIFGDGALFAPMFNQSIYWSLLALYSENSSRITS
jgi:hypothetical protein